MTRLLKLLIICGIFLNFLTACASSDRSGIGFVTTLNYANPKLEYYWFIPGNLETQTVPFMICLTGLSGYGQDFVTDEIRQFARRNRMVVIAPSFQFDEMGWQNRTSYQYPEYWSGEALLKIVDQFSSEMSLKRTGFYLVGASAGAQFSLRFSLWRPDLCRACAAYAAGGHIEPSTHNDVRYLIGIGTRDTTRIPHAEAFRDAANRYEIRLEYKTYDSDHAMPDQFIRDALDFIGSLISK